MALLDVPFVCCSYTNSFGELPEDRYSSVSIDDQAEAYRAVRLLLEEGHRNIAVLLDSIQDRSISQLRYMGYCRALRERGIQPDAALVGETGTFEMSAAYQCMTRMLQSGRDFTAVFAIADSMAVAAMKAIYDQGKRVPEDYSVVAIDGIDMSAYAVPTLTTLAQPQEEMGQRSVQILLDMIEGRGGNRHVQLRTALRTGGSVCPLSVFASATM